MFTDDELYLILSVINQPLRMDLVSAKQLIELEKKIKGMLDKESGIVFQKNVQ